ncbi:serine protease [Klebsiella variicola]|uniref:S1 family peptidase n=2 Tax=Klebsiella variicola TaxID=244366 RepID=UPI000F138DB7|nr:serine protease [Klebsiella variicola]MDW0346119.1 serine protease [Klebsiella variicola]WHE62704.1 serine protease [Klebsiella variicola]VCW24125.1 hypothetical protein BANRA_02087 [Klebsiella variicola]HBW0856564.1 trypsin-like peptidase domain-containing protein [Klebsiella variicola]HBW0862338.1 trypsin-like peptidase domain-containing protein [Klebsiella variicola]
MNEQWKKAVIHLECAANSKSLDELDELFNELREKLDNGEISHDEYLESDRYPTRDMRFHGTAVFLLHNERRYLLTARHVLFDQHSSAREFEERTGRIKEKTGAYYEHLCEMAVNQIFNIIFRVPSLDEALSGVDVNSQEFLMNLGAGPADMQPYTFSSPDLDLAIISLDNRDSRFADSLINLGYSPISSDLISDNPSSEGAEVFTVGYPSATSLLSQIPQTPAIANWSAGYLSLPVFSWGKVSMMNPHLPFYWCDMSIYPGNSGGPVVENGKIVGIVSAQASVPIEGVPQSRARIPFGKIIKASFIKGLIEEQESKDKKSNEWSSH